MASLTFIILDLDLDPSRCPAFFHFPLGLVYAEDLFRCGEFELPIYLYHWGRPAETLVSGATIYVLLRTLISTFSWDILIISPQ